jgi:hypothetical protein
MAAQMPPIHDPIPLHKLRRRTTLCNLREMMGALRNHGLYDCPKLRVGAQSGTLELQGPEMRLASQLAKKNREMTGAGKFKLKSGRPFPPATLFMQSVVMPDYLVIA